MKSLNNRRVCFCLPCFCLVFLLDTRCAATDEQPNVLFISLDDMNDWLGCYAGHPDAKTPNIDRLARRGVLFTNAHCVSPICGPSRAAVLTGMRPETTGVYHNRGTYVDYVPRAVTFPEHFRANGYLTLAAGKIDHGLGEPNPRLWNENGPDCGVLGTPFIGDELHTAAMTPKRVIDRELLQITLPANGGLSAIDRPNNTWDSFDWAPLDCPETDFPDRQIADWGIEKLGERHDRPILLALGFYKPHQPFFVPRKYFDLYDTETISLPPTMAGDLNDVPPPGRELAIRPWTSGTHKTVVAHGAWRDAVRAYLATVSFVDALVGRVVDALDQSPHAEDTWIVLWSDHGWSLGEKEHWGKHVPWREAVRMPLIIVPPKRSPPSGFVAGSRCDAAVSLLDLYPTLLDAGSLPSPPSLTRPAGDIAGLEGRSLLPLVADTAAPWKEAVVSTIGRGTHSVSTNGWRYIRYFDGGEELYDLRHDPREWHNVADKSEHVQRKEQLARHIPEDLRFKQFVRWGRWKCVFPVEGEPMLFDYHGEFGISEQNDVAAEHPDVIAKIVEYLAQNQINARRITMPETPQDGPEATENVALNPQAQDEGGPYPRVTASTEFGDKACFRGRNVINGRKENQGHGPRFPSWGPHKEESPWVQIDFSGPVEVDKVVLYLRADFPHDGYWKSGVLEFSDGSTVPIKLKKTGEGQVFKFPVRQTTVIKLCDLKWAEANTWCALTEFEVWGRRIGD